MRATVPVTTAIPFIGCLVLLTACNGSPDAGTTAGTGSSASSGGGSTSEPTTVTATDASSAAGSSAAAGAATALGLAELYQGGSPVAWRSIAPSTMAVSDAPSPESLILMAAVDAESPGTATAHSTNIDATKTVDLSLSGSLLGTVTFTSDAKDPTGATMDAGWWHIEMDFSNQSTPLTVTNDDKGVTAINSGKMEVYVHEGATTYTIGTTGTWTRTLDVWSIIPAATPLQMAVTAKDGSKRTVSLAGLRHVNRKINRDRGQTTAGKVTRVDQHQVDGDVSGLPTAVSSAWKVSDFSALFPNPSALSTPGAGTAALVPFTAWKHSATLSSDGKSHSYVWNRWAAFTVTAVRDIATAAVPNPAWTVTTSTPQQAIYLTKDGNQNGPFDGSKLKDSYGVVTDLTKVAQHL